MQVGARDVRHTSSGERHRDAERQRQREGGAETGRVVQEACADRRQRERQARQQAHPGVATPINEVHGQRVGEGLPGRLEDPVRHEQQRHDDRRPRAEQGADRGTTAERADLERARATQTHIGDVAPGWHRQREPDRPDRRDQPDLGRAEPSARQDDRDERIEDPQCRAQGQDDEAQGDHAAMVAPLE